MPNPDFPAWFAVGVVVERNPNAPQIEGETFERWLVTRVELEFPTDYVVPYDLEGSHYAIHLIPVLHTNEVDLERTYGVTITLPALRNRFRYTGLVMTPDGMREDDDFTPDETLLEQYVAAGGVDESTEEQAALEGFPSYLQTPDRAPEPGAPREAWDWRAHIDSLTRAGFDVSGLAEDTTHNREPGRPTYRRDNGGRFAHEEGFQVPPRADDEGFTEPDWEALSDEQLELIFGLFPEGPAPATGAQSIREAEDQRILAELDDRDVVTPASDPDPFGVQVIGPLRANNEGQPNPFHDPILDWAQRNQAGVVRPDGGQPGPFQAGGALAEQEMETFTEDMIPSGERDRPIVSIGQDWVLGQPHAGVWRVFGYAGEPAPHQVQDRATEWMMRNTTTQAWAYVGEDWLVDHGVRQMPPDPRHRQNVSTLGLPAVLLGQVWSIPLGRRKRASGRPVNFRVKEIKGDQVMLLSEEKNSGWCLYTTIAKLTGEGTLIGDDTPRRTSYERLLADDDVLDED